MSNGNTLYLECRSGISGDMTVAALLDLGATEENLRAELAKLPVDGYDIQIKKVVKSGLLVSDFDVILEHEVPAHTHEHSHMHPHVHRSWADIEKMLLESDLKPRVKALSHPAADSGVADRGRSDCRGDRRLLRYLQAFRQPSPECPEVLRPGAG